MKIIHIALLLFFSTLTSAMSLNTIVVFGDSLSDNGNLYKYMKQQLPVSPPYFKGRFSNGPVWIELLAQSYYPSGSVDHLLDYAFGGAGVMESSNEEDDELFTLKRELDAYFISHQGRADPQSLYVIWIGANNYLALPDDIDQAVKDVNAGIAKSVQRLVNHGAQYILVVNLPDLGKTPIARDIDAVDIMSDMSKRHNELLVYNMLKFKRSYPTLNWIYFDVNRAFDDMMVHPERFGFSNVISTCYEAAVLKPSANVILNMVATIKARAALTEDVCGGYLFFDPVHPSAVAHQVMAQSVRTLLDAKGIEFAGIN